jgi:transposase-like protein
VKQYSLEFKNQLIKEATETRNVSMVARKHGISAPTLYTWIRKSKGSDNGPGAPSRLRDLEKKLRASELENEVLKELLKKTNLAWLGGLPLLEHSSKTGGAK